MFFYAILACNPWQPIYEKELIWYDLERIKEELNIEPMPLKNGGGLGYHPRLVIHKNGMDFDNRALFLSQYVDAIKHGSVIGSKKRQLIDKRSFIALENGYVTQSQKWDGIDYQKIEIPELNRVLEEQKNFDLYIDESTYLEEIDDVKEIFTITEMEFTHTRNSYSRDITIIAEPNIPMKTIIRVMSTTIRKDFGTMLAGWKDGQIQGILPKPVEAYQKPRPNLWPSAHPLHCNIQTSPSKGWISCGNAPPITTNKDCTRPDWSSIMKDLAILNERCAPYWEKLNKRTPYWYNAKDSGIELFPYVTGDLTFREFVEQLETAYDAYPAVHQYYYPLLSTRTHHDGCAYSLDIPQLNQEQLEAICTRADESTIDRVFPSYAKHRNHTPRKESP